MDKDAVFELQQSIERLAQGANPFTGEIAKSDEILNDVRVSRCLFAVNDILRDIVNGDLTAAATTTVKMSANKTRKHKFQYDETLAAQVEIQSYPISLSQIIRNVLVVFGSENKLKYADLAQVLLQKGLFVENSEKSPKLIASESAAQYGITLRRVHGKGGDRWQTVFDQNGQKFVIDLLRELE